jgi:hypothetical protein
VRTTSPRGRSLRHNEHLAQPRLDRNIAEAAPEPRARLDHVHDLADSVKVGPFKRAHEYRSGPSAIDLGG